MPNFEALPLANLRFDPENPRLPLSLREANIPDVLAFMLQDAGLVDLMASIAKQGFFPGEPLLVSPQHREEDRTYVVVEGNRRFAACLLLANPSLAPLKMKSVLALAETASTSIESIPCLIFEHRGEILTHLGYRHVTGIKEWEPLAKARFLRQRYDAEVGPQEARFKSIAASIGSRADYVGRLLTAYELYLHVEENSFYGEATLQNGIEFSLITSFLAYGDIAAFLGLSSSRDLQLATLRADHLEFLIKFVFVRGPDRKTRLGESRNLSKLADVLSNGRATEELMSGTVSLDRAAQIAGVGSEAFRSLISTSIESISLAAAELPTLKVSQDDVQLADTLKKQAIRLSRRVIDSLSDEEEE